ncbi:MAG: hypothetical protein WC460_03110 [Patescibacteria group bacterium]
MKFSTRPLTHRNESSQSIDYSELPNNIKLLCAVCLGIDPVDFKYCNGKYPIIDIARFRTMAGENIEIWLPLTLKKGEPEYQPVAEIKVDLTWMPFVKAAIKAV